MRDHEHAERVGLLRMGEAIRERRLARGWSQRDLERASGVDQTTISRIERGLIRGLKLWYIGRLNAVLAPESRPLWPVDTTGGDAMADRRPGPAIGRPPR